MRARLIGILLAGACTRQHFRTVEAVTSCSPAPEMANAAPVGASVWRAGRYQLAQVITSLPDGRAPLLWEDGELRLTLPSREQLDASKLRGFGRSPRRDLRFVGTWTVRDGPQSQSAEVDGDTLYLGLRVGFDASPTALAAEGASGRRIWGSWKDPQTGYVVVADPVTHEPLKKLTGVFCAERVGP